MRGTFFLICTNFPSLLSIWVSRNPYESFSHTLRKGTGIEDSWGGTDCGSGGDGVGVSNGEKGRTTVTEQQQQKKATMKLKQETGMKTKGFR